MARKPPQLFNVHCVQDGAQVVTLVPLAVARAEASRLSAEARVRNPETGQPTGMHMGSVCTFEARSVAGVVI